MFPKSGVFLTGQHDHNGELCSPRFRPKAAVVLGRARFPASPKPSHFDRVGANKVSSHLDVDRGGDRGRGFILLDFLRISCDFLNHVTLIGQLAKC